jgi:cleavage stimulation factor subunit 2
LNDYEIGGRQLRVDYAAMDDNQGRPSHQGGGGGGNMNQNRHQGNLYQQQPPPMPQQQQLPPPPMPQQPMQLPPQQAPPQPIAPVANLSSVDEISKVLASMNSQDLFTLMSQMKVKDFVQC